MKYMNWIVIRTKSNMEIKVSLYLINQGFETFLPKYKKFISHARKVSQVEKPLFPRYIFVNISKQKEWQRINNTHGVSNILMNDNIPSYIPENVFDSFVNEFDSDGFLKFKQGFKTGEQIKIINYSFHKYKTIFKEYVGKKKAKLLLKVFNNEITLITDINKLSALI